MVDSVTVHLAAVKQPTLRPHMIYLHKLLPLLVSPLVLVLLLGLYGVIKKRRRFMWIALLGLYVASLPLVGDRLFAFVEAGQVRSAAAQAPVADAVVVLSGMLTTVQTAEGVISEWGDADRFFGGIELMQAGRAPLLIFTAGVFPWLANAQPEGVVLKRWAQQIGIAEKNIRVTAEVQNTEQEAQAVKQVLPQAQPKVLLVTSAFHMQRAKKIFENAGLQVHPYPVDFKVNARSVTLMDFFPHPNALGQTDTAIRETLGRAYYQLKFWVRSVSAK